MLALSICMGYAIIGILCITFAPHGKLSRSAMENKRFIASSPSWLDRQVCRWFGICGAMNWLRLPRKTPGSRAAPSEKSSKLPDHPPHDFTDAWIDPTADPNSWSKNERGLRKIPGYVFDYAPLIHLYGHEKFWPSDLAEHLEHTYAKLDDDTIPDFKLNLWNLADLNEYEGGRNVFLTSKDDPESEPEWLLSPHNIPGVPGSDPNQVFESTPGKRKGRKNMKAQARKEGWALVRPKYSAHEEEMKPIEGDVDSEGEEPAFEVKIPSIHFTEGDPQRVLRQRRRSSSTQVSNKTEEAGQGLRSNAPAFLICIDKGDGIVDAFWFYFYSFNEGNSVFGITFGNHVGDWEHTMVRFQNGEPKAVYLSRHAWGSVYSYDALEKIGNRVRPCPSSQFASLTVTACRLRWRRFSRPLSRSRSPELRSSSRPVTRHYIERAPVGSCSECQVLHL